MSGEKQFLARDEAIAYIVHTYGYALGLIFVMMMLGGTVVDYIISIGVEWISVSNLGFGVIGFGIIIVVAFSEFRIGRYFKRRKPKN